MLHVFATVIGISIYFFLMSVTYDHMKASYRLAGASYAQVIFLAVWCIFWPVLFVKNIFEN